MSVKSATSHAVNKALRPLGVQLVRGWSPDPAIQPFLSAHKTLAAAERSGLSLEEYLDNFSAEPGATARAANFMLTTADLSAPVARVCEIGPGSGRYAQHVVEALRPRAYEIYETARDWHAHLESTVPNVVNQPADGHSLSSTTTASVDLVHSHKVFVYLPLVTTLSYLEEMARVVRPGGVVAFDIIDENCLDDATVRSWIAQDSTIYGMIPRQWTIDLLSRHALTLLGSTLVPLSGAHTELLVFRREPTA